MGQQLQAAGGQQRPEAIQAIPVRHPWRWVAAVVVLALAALVVYTFATAPDLHWDVVSQFLFFPRILQAVLVTLELTVLAMVIGIVTRRRARRDAPLGKPGRVFSELVLHLVLPRHAGPRADLLLVQHRDHPSSAPIRDSVHEYPVGRGHQQHRLPLPGRNPRARVSTRLRTCRRSCAPGSSRSTRVRPRRRRHSG